MGLHGRFTKAISKTDLARIRASDTNEELFGVAERVKELVERLVSTVAGQNLAGFMKIADAGGLITATTVEAALAELATAIGGAAGSATVTNGGVGNAGKLLKLDGNGKAAGRVLETDGAKLDTFQVETAYPRLDGSRAFTGVVGGVTPTLAAHLTRKDYVDTAATSEANIRTALAALSTAAGVNGQRIIDLGEPTASAHAATKNYVDTFIQGLRLKANARTATAVALDAYTPSGNVLTFDANGALTIGGIAVDNGDLVLVKDEAGADAPYNGWYVVTDKGSAGTPGILTRADFASTAAELAEGSFGWVAEGTHANHRFAISAGPAVINVNDVTFTQIGGALSTEAGAALSQNGAALDVNVDDSTIQINADALRVKALGITDAHVAVANKDGLAGTASMRTLGTGATQAYPGNLGDAATAAIAAATTDTGVGAGNAGKLVELDGDGKLDGRDVGTDGTKLDGIEALADVTDTANVDAAGALMHTDVAANTKRVVLMRNADGVTYSSYVFHSAAATPSSSDNTAAGYADGSFWFDSSSGALWVKVYESGGQASWSRAASRTLRQVITDNLASQDVTGMTWDHASIKSVRLKGWLSLGTSIRETFDLVVLLDSATPGNSTVTVVDSTKLGDPAVTFALVDSGGTNRKLQATATSLGSNRILELYVDTVHA